MHAENTLCKNKFSPTEILQLTNGKRPKVYISVAIWPFLKNQTAITIFEY